MALALVDAPSRPRPVPSTVEAFAPILATLLAVALVTRAPWFGDPAIGNDEQFYLLVGDRMWHGALPYVDIWDRKPIGLFLIYAAIRPFSADGILAYQVAALGFATATAFVIARIAARLVPPGAATVAGCLYLVLLPVFGGLGGQSPVFYNLFMATAGLLVVKAGEDKSRSGRFAVGAMALAGLAIQVKYTAFVEGMGFGIWLLLTDWRRGARVLALAGRAMLWIGVALAPTAAALIAYVLLGHAQAFLFANFWAIFLKHAPISEFGNIAANFILIGPLLGFAGAAFVIAWRGEASRPFLAFMAFWIVAAFGGYFVIGHFYTHYLLPALVPLSAVCGVLAARIAGLLPLALYALVFYAGTTEFPGTARIAADHRKIDALVGWVAPYTAYGCPYLADGPAIVYHLAHACLPTRYVFNEHLSNASERYAVDQPRGLDEVLRRRPPVIIMRRLRDEGFVNLDNDRTLRRALADDYRWTALVPARRAQESLDVYVRRDLP